MIIITVYQVWETDIFKYIFLNKNLFYYCDLHQAGDKQLPEPMMTYTSHSHNELMVMDCDTDIKGIKGTYNTADNIVWYHYKILIIDTP